MKKLFMEPALTVDMFASEDVIAASYEVNGDGDDVWHDVSNGSGDNGGRDIFGE